ncbi:MAG: GNAT family N-acetyltransferase [Candidatus Eisenbacteria bacterium]|nr:GNAT family N-acetyltransferase [Candidatus Eisenbacteria bacterium]
MSRRSSPRSTRHWLWRRSIPTRGRWPLRSASGVIGLAMYGVDQASGTWKIYRLLIDAASQGAGMGRAAVRALIRILAEAARGRESILVSYHSRKCAGAPALPRGGFRELKWTRGRSLPAGRSH